MCEITDAFVEKIDEFMEVFSAEVLSILDGRELSEVTPEERKTTYVLARESAFEKQVEGFDFLKQCYEQRMAQLGSNGNGGAVSAKTDAQKIGAYLLGRFGSFSAGMMTSGSPRGFTGIYQHLADIVDIIYPDDIMADLFGMSKDGVSTARCSVRRNGYSIDRVSPGSVGCESTTRSWWKVTGRPEPEPEPEDPRLTKLRSIFPGKSDEQLSMFLAFAGD